LVTLTPTMARVVSVVVTSWMLKAGRKASVGHLHDAGIRIGGGHAWGRVLGAALLLDRGDVGELGECVLEPREPILCDARHVRGVAGRERGVGRRAGDLDEVGASLEHEPLEGVTASERRSAGGGANGVPSCATRWRSMRSCFMSRARSWVTSLLKTSPWSLRKSLRR
jgi:hypothetical protein